MIAVAVTEPTASGHGRRENGDLLWMTDGGPKVRPVDDARGARLIMVTLSQWTQPGFDASPAANMACSIAIRRMTADTRLARCDAASPAGNGGRSLAGSWSPPRLRLRRA